MRVYVLDASVILTFLLGKNRSAEKKFIKFLNQVRNGKAKFQSGYLLPLEIANGLRYSLADENLAIEVFQKFSALPIDYFSFSSAQLTRILQLSYLFKASFYDTSYHFLAKLLKGTFLTCDARYFKKAKGYGHIEIM